MQQAALVRSSPDEGSLQKMKRYLFIALVTVLTIAGLPALASAAGNVEKTVTYEMVAPASGLVATRVDRDVPPSGGCVIDLGGKVTAEYINGGLVSTQADYAAWIDCDTLGNTSQTMRHLWVGAEQYRNGTLAQPDATPRECSHESSSQPTCVDVRSEAVAFCYTISMVCAGSYYIDGGYSLLLPAGWIWSTISPNCLRLSPAEITCALTTVPVNVSPIYP